MGPERCVQKTVRRLALALLLGMGAVASAVAQESELFVSSYFNGAIIKFSENMATGTTFVAPGSAGLTTPTGITFGPDRNSDGVSDLYVTSTDQNKIYCFSGSDGSPVGVFASQIGGGGGTSFDLAFGPDGNLYVLHQHPDGSGTVERYNGQTAAPMGTFISGGFTAPRGITFGPAGDIYVSATGGVIRHYNGTSGAYLGDVVSIPSPHKMQFGPDGDMYVASYYAGRIERFHGRTLSYMGTFAGPSGGALNGVVGLAFAPNGNLFAASIDTSSVLSFGSLGESLGAALTAGDLNGASFIAFRPAPTAPPPLTEEMVIASQTNSAVLSFDGLSGAFHHTIAPSGANGVVPFGVAEDPNGFLYVGGGNRVLKYDRTTGEYLGDFVTQVDGGAGNTTTFDICFHNGYLYVLYEDNPNARAHAAKFDGLTGARLGELSLGVTYTPRGITVGPEGNLYISCRDASATGRVYRYDLASDTMSPFVSLGPGGSPQQTAFRNGYFYVTDFYEGRVFQFDATTGTAVGPTGVFVDSHAGGLNGAVGLAFGPDDNLYVSSWYTNQVLQFDGSTGQYLRSFTPDHFNGLQKPSYLLFRHSRSDATAPTVTYSQSPLANTAGWNKDDVTVTLTATDNPGGSGVASISYRFGTSGDFTTVTGATLTLPVTAEGVLQLQYYATDNAGNSSPTDAQVLRIDKTAPTTASQMAVAGALTTVTLTASDALSGVAQTLYQVDGGTVQTYSAPLSLPRTGGHTLTHWSVDVAGNEGQHVTEPVKATATVTVRLTDSNGGPLAGAKAQYYQGGWHDIGFTSADGTVAVELSPATYTFSIDYGGARNQKSHTVAGDTSVAFQTLRATVQLLDSAGSPLPGGKAQYYAGGWRDIGTTGVDGSVGVELLPGTYTFSVDYAGARTQKSQNVAANPSVVFQTARASVRLIDSSGNPLAGAKAQYYAGGWKDIGFTGADGTVSVELPAGTYTFSIDYAGGRIQTSQNTGADPTVLFQTVRAVVRLKDSQGAPLAGGKAQYYAGSWRDMGLTAADGTVGAELLPNTYTFSLDYAYGRVQKSQSVAGGAEAVFQTGRVHSASGRCVQYYGGAWRAFVNDMELLPLAVTFKFNDGTANTVYTVTAGGVTDIH